ncbi:MAG: hypothetical protein ACYDBJ_10145 [Aggregatilineales bacterium]
MLERKRLEPFQILRRRTQPKSVEEAPLEARRISSSRSSEPHRQKLSVQDVLHLQRTVGNQAVMRILNERTSAPGKITPVSGMRIQRYPVTLSNAISVELPDIDDSFDEEEEYVDHARSTAAYGALRNIEKEKDKLLDEVESHARDYWKQIKGGVDEKERDDSNEYNEEKSDSSGEKEKQIEPEKEQLLPLVTNTVGKLTFEEISQYNTAYSNKGLRGERNTMGKPPGDKSLSENTQTHEKAAVTNANELITEAIRLGIDVVYDQSFSNGNHRTAAQAIYFLLLKNGFELTCPVYEVHAVLSHVRMSDDVGGNYKKANGQADLKKVVLGTVKPLDTEQKDNYTGRIQSELSTLPDLIGLMNQYRLASQLPGQQEKSTKEQIIEKDAKITEKLNRYVRLGGQFS